MKISAIFCIFALFTSCVFQLDQAANRHREVAHLVNLGDSKNKVLSILLPTQENLPREAIRVPDRYLDGSTTVEIYYMRSGRQADGITTDDEYTPYVFKNGILAGIGWQQLGGAKSHGKVVPQTNVNTSTTIINP
jgi:hypothetical protein